MSDTDALDFPKDPEEARQRFEEFGTKDPFPSIPPALLNARDIYHYARVTGVIHPFPYNDSALLKKKLKPASFEIDFIGTVHYTDEDGKHQEEAISQGKPFTLKKNTIAFVFVTTKFYLPDYIAIRFNLRIHLVHKGLLLGTGPLVDPGFSGQLLIPLHNLTSKDYVLIGGDGLIWVEFTKLSNSKADDVGNPNKTLDFTPSFPPEKRNKNAQFYFNESSDGKPAISSIPGAIKIAKEDAENAKAAAISAANDAEGISKKLEKYGIVALGALAVALVGLTITTWNLISAANNNVANAALAIAQNREEQETLLAKIKALEAQLVVLGAKDGKKIALKKTSNSNSNCALTLKIGCQQNCQPECSSK